MKILHVLDKSPSFNKITEIIAKIQFQKCFLVKLQAAPIEFTIFNIFIQLLKPLVTMYRLNSLQQLHTSCAVDFPISKSNCLHENYTNQYNRYLSEEGECPDSIRHNRDLPAGRACAASQLGRKYTQTSLHQSNKPP